MGVGDDGEGFGFAPRGDPVRKKIGRRGAVHTGPPPAASQAFPPQSALVGIHGHRVQKPPLIWLLIGLLLGVGGTLLTASFWLPDGTSSQVAGLEVGERERGATESGASAAMTAPPVSTEPKAAEGDKVAERTPEDDVAAERTAPASGLDEAPASSGPDERPPISAGEARNDVSDTPEETPDDEALQPPASPDIREDAGDVASVDDGLAALSPPEADGPETASETPSLSPEEALAALASTAEPPSPSNEPAGRSGPDREEPVARAPLSAAPDRPASTTDADLAVPGATPPDTAVSDGDGEAGAPTEPSGTNQAAPADDAGPAELPPRIKQALAAARAEPTAASGSRAANGNRLYRVQLAAVDDEAAARIFWREVNQRLPGIFADVEPIFDRRQVEERLYLRVWVGAFDSRIDADGYCGWLKEQGQDCFVTRVDNL